MSLAVGNLFGPYEVTAKLGAGGMGEVWRATDTRLRRDVAIKVLPAAFTADKERLSRFKREAQLLAQLHHPNIASIFGLEESDGVRALVMELIDGEDLSARIARGPLPLDETLPIARQIAEALEAAHEKGIVHRDLKPANVKLTADGGVKVLDFGLAKAVAAPSSGPPATEAHGLPAALMDSPTQTSASDTELGVVLGTAAYMAPEQARGLAADKRADIWSFGVVLYEMLTGRRLFAGDSTTDVLAAVLTQPVDWAALPASTPRALHTLLRRCLERNPKSRLRDIADARFVIEDLFAGRSEVGQPPLGLPPRSGPLRQAARLAATALVAALLGGLAIYFFMPGASTAPRRTIRFSVAPPAKNVFTPLDSGGGMALAPDGLQMVFVATDDQQVKRLWRRAFDAVEAQPLAGTEGASYPFWSPDGRWIAYFAGGLLRKVGLAGAPPQTICTAASARGGSWGADGTIIFAPEYTDPLHRVSANGGSPAPLTALDARGLESSHRFPSFLPDGRRFVYLVRGDRERKGVYLGSLTGAAPRLLVRTGYNAVFAPPRHLLYARDRALVAQPLDEQLLPDGEPILIEPQVSQAAERTGNALFSAAAGAVAYRRGERTEEQLQLRWYDRGGRQVGVVGPETAGYRDPAPSPDGKRLAVNQMIAELGVYQIFIVEADSGSATRFTFETSDDWLPVWSPDGSRLAFGCNQRGQGDRICVRAGSGAGAVEVLLAPATGARPTDWSADGSLLVYELGPRTAKRDLWALPLDRSKKPFAVVATAADEGQGQLSPDGSLLAYTSDESGRYETYVQPLGGGGKWQVSTAGGTQPRWRRDGRELFFLDAAQRVVAVPCRATSGAFQAGPPRALFQAHVGGILGVGTDEFVPSPDGQRFLVATLLDQPDAGTPIIVVLDWAAELAAH